LQYLVLACDGIWDVMTNQDVANFVVKAVHDIRATGRDTTTNDLKSIAEGMLDDCLGRGSRDNMSVVIVALPGAGVFVPVTPSNSSDVHSASATVGPA
jgi:protein phosphatase 1B